MKPNVISHRGANFFAPQNTIPAFQKSIEIGVDGFETDVHLTKDGVPVICHNYTIDATSDQKGKVSDYTLEELRNFDFGTSFAEAYKGTQIPTVAELLELFAKTDMPVLNIELKSPKDKSENQIVEKTIDLVREYNLVDRLLISSFNPELLVIAKTYEPGCKTGVLYIPTKKVSWSIIRDPYAFAKGINADALHPFEMFVNKNYVQVAHAAGLEVNVWTVDKPKSIENMIDFECDGIITNHPDLVKHIIAVKNA